MSDIKPAADEPIEDQDDPEELAVAYEALEEDRRQQAQLAQAHTTTSPQPADSASIPHGTLEATADPSPATGSVEAQPEQHAKAAPGVGRRVFLIDGKEYPDPDASLPIIGARSVQAMYRDYYPGQLDNADVVQKTRADGTLEVTFKRRIGTKGLGRRATPPTGADASGGMPITVSRVSTLIAALPDDWPLAWDLVAQAIAPDGTVRLDYVPASTQLNLAEAQQAARTRLIEIAVDELCRLRPCI